MKNSYPVFLLPKNWHDLKKNLAVPSVPKNKPLKPHLQSRDSSSDSFGCIVAIIGLILYIVGQIISEESEYIMVTSGVVIIFIGLVVNYVIQEIAENDTTDAKFRLKMRNYKTQLANYDEKVSDKQEYDDLCSLSKVELRRVMQSRCSFEIADNGFYSNTKSGITENYFSAFLFKEFGDKILTGKCVKFVNINAEYYPDFIYYDKDRNIYLDIEIDEPYTFVDKIPIHFGDLDKKRDKCFVSSYWSVFRVSEQQIIESPDKCIMTIKNFVEYLHDNSLPFNNYVRRQPKWTEELANGFIAVDSRKTLLKRSNII